MTVEQEHMHAVTSIPHLNSDFRPSMTFRYLSLLNLERIIANVTNNAAIIRTAVIIIAAILPSE